MLRIPRASGAGRRGAGRGLVGQVGVGGHAWTPRWRRWADPRDPAVPFLRGPSSPRLLCLGTHSLQTRAEHLPPPTVRRSSQTTENLHQTKSHGLGYHGDHKAFTASCAQEPPERAPTGGLTCGRSAAARALPGAKHTAASRLASGSDLGTQGRLSQAVLLNTAFSFDHSLFPSRGSGSGSCPSQPHLTIIPLYL